MIVDKDILCQYTYDSSNKPCVILLGIVFAYTMVSLLLGASVESSVSLEATLLLLMQYVLSDAFAHINRRNSCHLNMNKSGILEMMYRIYMHSSMCTYKLKMDDLGAVKNTFNSYL